jgi:hypothetical protein
MTVGCLAAIAWTSDIETGMVVTSPGHYPRLMPVIHSQPQAHSDDSMPACRRKRPRPSKLVMRVRFSSPAPPLPNLVSRAFAPNVRSRTVAVLGVRATYGPHFAGFPANPDVQSSGNLTVPLAGRVLVDQAARMLPWPIRCISSRVLAPLAAARLLPVCRRSWKWNPTGSPALTTRFDQSTDRCQLFRRSAAPSGPWKVRLWEPATRQGARA